MLKTALDKNPLDENLQVAYIKQLLLMQQKNTSDNYVKQLQQNPKITLMTKFMISNYLLSRQKYVQGEKLLNSILSKDKNNIKALYQLNKFYFMQGKYAQASPNYRRIIAQDNMQLNAYFGLINSLLAQQKYPLQSEKYLSSNYSPSYCHLL
ncbi:hypothetical protein JI57_03020 [Psychromonas sp. PRT-SC03]|nr:hypothetical protein JI57_03020 [Psychromonas sp. PRT-SC03]